MSRFVMGNIAAMLIICCSLFVVVKDAYSATQNTTVELIRYDRLPDLPGNLSTYDLNALPSTTEKFMIVAAVWRDVALATFPNGNIWVKGWEAAPLGDVVIKTIRWVL